MFVPHLVPQYCEVQHDVFNMDYGTSLCDQSSHGIMSVVPPRSGGHWPSTERPPNFIQNNSGVRTHQDYQIAPQSFNANATLHDFSNTQRCASVRSNSWSSSSQDSLPSSPSPSLTSPAKQTSPVLPIKTEPEEGQQYERILNFQSTDTESPSSCPPSSEIPLRATHASKKMRKMMGVFRVNIFAGKGRGKTRHGQGSGSALLHPSGPLIEPSQIFVLDSRTMECLEDPSSDVFSLSPPSPIEDDTLDNRQLHPFPEDFDLPETVWTPSPWSGSSPSASVAPNLEYQPQLGSSAECHTSSVYNHPQMELEGSMTEASTAQSLPPQMPIVGGPKENQYSDALLTSTSQYGTFQGHHPTDLASTGNSYPFYNNHLSFSHHGTSSTMAPTYEYTNNNANQCFGFHQSFDSVVPQAYSVGYTYPYT